MLKGKQIEYSQFSSNSGIIEYLNVISHTFSYEFDEVTKHKLLAKHCLPKGGGTKNEKRKY